MIKNALLILFIIASNITETFQYSGDINIIGCCINATSSDIDPIVDCIFY